MKYKLVVVGVEHVEKSPNNDPTREEVASFIEDDVVNRYVANGWKIKQVTAAHLDVETLAQMVAETNLTGEQTVELMGRITADSVTKAIEKWADEKKVMDDAKADPR